MDVCTSGSNSDVDNTRVTGSFIDHTTDHNTFARTGNRKYKVVYSVHLCLAYLICGWVLAQIGSALLDLKQITSSTLEQVSLYQTFYNVGYLFGSFLTAVIHNKVDRFLFQFFSILGVGLTLVAVPWCSIHGVMITAHFVIGIGCGIIDSVVNTEMLSVWGSQGLSFMQAMHFSYALGGILSPIVTAQFLLSKQTEVTSQAAFNDSNVLSNYPRNQTYLVEKTINFLKNSSTAHLNLTIDLKDSYRRLSPEFQNFSSKISKSIRIAEASRVYIAYSISAGLCVVIALMFLFLFFKIDQSKLEGRQQNVESKPRKALNKPLKYTVLLVMGAMAAIYIAIEESFSGFLNAYCVTYFDWTSSNGSYATSVFYGFFGFGRLVAVFWVKCINPQKILGLFCGAVVLLFLALTFGGLYKIDLMIWFISALTGLIISIIYPTIFTWTEDRFLSVSGKISGYFNFTSGIGGMVNPVIVGTLMDEFTPMWYCYILTGEAVLLCVICVLGVILTRKVKYLKERDGDDAVQVEEKMYAD